MYHMEISKNEQQRKELKKEFLRYLETRIPEYRMPATKFFSSFNTSLKNFAKKNGYAIKSILDIDDVQLAEVVFRNDTDRIIYEYIRENGFITSHQILDITRINTPQGANVALGRLMEMGLVKKIRKGRQFIYQLIK